MLDNFFIFGSFRKQMYLGNESERKHFQRIKSWIFLPLPIQIWENGQEALKGLEATTRLRFSYPIFAQTYKISIKDMARKFYCYPNNACILQGFL